MTQDTAFIIKLQVRKEGEFHFVTSPNLPGLNVCGTSVDNTYQSVVKVVKALFKHNHNFIVDVFPATAIGVTFKLRHHPASHPTS